LGRFDGTAMKMLMLFTQKTSACKDHGRET